MSLSNPTVVTRMTVGDEYLSNRVLCTRICVPICLCMYQCVYACTNTIPMGTHVPTHVHTHWYIVGFVFCFCYSLFCAILISISKPVHLLLCAMLVYTMSRIPFYASEGTLRLLGMLALKEISVFNQCFLLLLLPVEYAHTQSAGGNFPETWVF